MPKLKLAATSQFKIEKGVAQPDRGRRHNWPFGEMEVGDSFALPADLYVKVNSAASYHGWRHQRKYSVRMDGDGYRCWRVR